MKTLLKNCYILKRNSHTYEILKKAYLVFEDDIIVYVGNSLPKDKFDYEIDLTNKLVMPGLINCHGHAPMTLLRGLGGGYKLQDWLNKVIYPIEDKMVPNDIYIGSKLAIMEMLSSGTTTYSEMYDFPYAESLAIAESGIRCNICRAGLCFDSNLAMKDWPRFNQVLDFANNMNGNYTYNEEMLKELGVYELPEVIKTSIKDKRIRGDISIHSPYLSTPNLCEGLSKVEGFIKNTFQIHLSESKKEHNDWIKKYGKTPTQYFYDLGIFDKYKVYAAHCVYLSDSDFEIFKKCDASIVYNPTSNAKLANGVANIKKALDMGINVCLGTDGCSSNDNLDMFEEMHIGILLQSAWNKKAGIVSPKDMIDMATINGAKALNRNDIGKIEVGYKADLCIIDLEKPHLIPHDNNILDLIVYSVHGSDVYMSIVDGKILYKDNKFLTIDKVATYKEFKNVFLRLTNK